MSKGFFSKLGMMATAASVLAGPARAEERLMFWPSLPFKAGSINKGTKVGLQAPEEWKNFCVREGGVEDCTPMGEPDSVVVMVYEQRRELDEALAYSNRCAYQDDQVTYGKPDHWTKPVVEEGCKADCEDAALLARHYLIKKGWPSSALLLTMVSTADNSGPDFANHLVLTARTSVGDLILDRVQMMAADELALHGNRVMARQSTYDPNLWEWVNPLPVADERFGVAMEPVQDVAGVGPFSVSDYAK